MQTPSQPHGPGLVTTSRSDRGLTTPIWRKLTPWRTAVLLAIVFLGLSIRRKHWILSVRTTEFLDRRYSAIAERDAGTPRQDRRWEQRLLRGFSQTDRYAEANRALQPTSPDRVVLYGDSITDYWVTRSPSLFSSGSHYIGRGIGGQATPELLWRLRQDVLDLHPGTMVLLAGTNDVVLRGRQISDAETRENLRRMVTITRQQGIRVVLCSLLPVRFDQPRRQQLSVHRILGINAWLRQYAAENHLVYVDYFDALADRNQALPEAVAVDGLHPNAEGYRIMERLLLQGLATKP